MVNRIKLHIATKLIFYVALVYFSSCRKDTIVSKKEPCIPETFNYYLPDSFYNWYTDIVDTTSNQRFFILKSNSGLTETIEANKASPFNVYEDGFFSSKCDKYNYWGCFYSYRSNLYKHYFSINVDFQYDDVDANRYTYGKAYTDTVNLVLNYVTYNSNTVWNTHVFMVQQLIPFKSNKLKMVYFTADQPTITEICDTCIQDVGEVKQGNNVYSNVTRYLSTFNESISSTVVSEFLIDKKYGIIQFKKRDGTTWTIEPK